MHVRGVRPLLPARLAPGRPRPASPAARPAPPPPARAPRPGRGTRSARCDRTPDHPAAARARTASPAGSAPPRPPAGRSGPPSSAAPSPPPAATAATRRPRTPNAAANSSSAIHWPSRSRTATASGTRRPAYSARIAAATTGSGSGRGTARIDITHPILRPDEEGTRPHRTHWPATRPTSRTKHTVSRINHQHHRQNKVPAHRHERKRLSVTRQDNRLCARPPAPRSCSPAERCLTRTSRSSSRKAARPARAAQLPDTRGRCNQGSRCPRLPYSRIQARQRTR